MSERHELDAGMILCIPLLVLMFVPPIPWFFYWSEMRGENAPSRLCVATFLAATHAPALVLLLYLVI